MSATLGPGVLEKISARECGRQRGLPQALSISPPVGPYVHENLTIFLVHGPDQSFSGPFTPLEEAMERKVVVVHETSEVNELAIENRSRSEEVFVQAGDIVKGGQQDRMLAVDLILSADSGRMPIDAFCVEHGRWTQRGTEQ